MTPWVTPGMKSDCRWHYFSLTSLIKCSFVSSHCKQTRYLLPFVSLTMWLLKESFLFNYTTVSNQVRQGLEYETSQYRSTLQPIWIVFIFERERLLTASVRWPSSWERMCVRHVKPVRWEKRTESEKSHSRKAKTAKLQLTVNVLHYNKWLHYNKVVFNHPLCFNEYNCGTICWSALK